jgi:hypothetical protein
MRTPDGNPDSFVDDLDDWQNASVMSGFQEFDPINERSRAKHSAESQPQLHQLGEPDWSAWETPRNASPTLDPAEPTKDEHFFAAYDRMGLGEQQRKASPPIIDLRPMEKKLEREKELASSGLQADDIRFFESFDTNPRAAMAKSREDSYRRIVSLNDGQKESMNEAQASPMNIQITPRKEGRPSTADYFGGGDDLLTGSPTVMRADQAAATSMSPKREGSWTEAAGVWAGSLKRTFGSLRGHLPTARDFYVPETEGEESRGPTRTPSPDRRAEPRPKDVAGQEIQAPKRHSRKLVQSEGHSHGTPFASTFDSHSVSQPPTRSNGGSQHSGTALHAVPGHHSSAPVSGAPGFDPNTGRNWNTGAWSLTSQQETERRNRPIPVALKGRREETQEVVDDSLAARLTARLPKRLQLGKTWKLLYSSDQHGISLSTLYWKVASGLDVNKGGGRSGGGVADAEGWLRGASTATKAALTGANVQRVGSGLSIGDAGLVLAIKDNDDHVFGAFVNERLRAQSTYYGNGECFLWKQTDGGSLKAYPWTGKNDYMALTEAHYLSFGGGEGKYGLWVDGALETGVSASCPAFDNEVLCDGLEESRPNEGEARFECITLEVWACGID